jgi:poly(ADP-ribose) glycohydrolase ARH3
MSAELENRFTGCLLGLGLGDALGAPFEGSPGGEGGRLGHLVHNPPPLLSYTDDTEMAMAVARSLAERNGFDPGHMARVFAENFNPMRGYGPGTMAVLGLIKRGIPWEMANKMVFPQGSFGNGAAMRAAPIGLFYWKDPDKLRDVAYPASSITHAHPLAKEGAFLITRTVADILSGKKRAGIARGLPGLSVIKEYREKLDILSELLERDPQPPGDVASALGNGIEALESAPTALYAFLRYGDDYLGTVSFCITLGGDTDTISAMAGAMAGAYLGEEGLPAELTRRLEDRDILRALALSLHRAATGGT